jgi:hypothetical protein
LTYVLFDRVVSVDVLLPSRILVNGVALTWIGPAAVAFPQYGPPLASAGDPWLVAAGVDPSVQVGGVDAVFRSASGLILPGG